MTDVKTHAREDTVRSSSDSPPFEKPAYAPAGAEGELDESELRASDRALVRKMDLHLIPFLTLLFLLSFLDRINLGVAKLAGLTTELRLSSLQFNTASMIFFVTYVAFEVPSNLILKKMRPSRWIPLIVVCWGITQTLMGLVTKYSELLGLRALLGFFECGLFPGLSFYLSSWYPRRDLGLAATLAGAFGGILGYALSKMDGIGGKQGWSWIFIIEGLLTTVVGCIAPWFVHDFPTDKPRFLTEPQRLRVLERLFKDSGVANTAKFSWRQVKIAVLDYKTILFMLIYIGVAEPIYSQSLFSPTIVAALGKWSRSQSLLLTTPPYVLAFFTTVGTALLGDRWQIRGPLMMFWSAMSSIGYIILIATPITKPGVLYFAVFLTVASIAPGIATTIAWVGSSYLNHYKKATAMGLTFTLGNAGGIVASQIYRTQDAPKYNFGHAITLGFSVMCFICSTLLHFLLKRENARRDAAYGPPPPVPVMGEKYPDEVLKNLGLYGKTEDEIIDMGDYVPTFRYQL